MLAILKQLAPSGTLKSSEALITVGALVLVTQGGLTELQQILVTVGAGVYTLGRSGAKLIAQWRALRP
jgi:hypothetical protein